MAFSKDDSENLKRIADVLDPPVTSILIEPPPPPLADRPSGWVIALCAFLVAAVPAFPVGLFLGSPFEGLVFWPVFMVSFFMIWLHFRRQRQRELADYSRKIAEHRRGMQEYRRLRRRQVKGIDRDKVSA